MDVLTRHFDSPEKRFFTFTPSPRVPHNYGLHVLTSPFSYEDHVLRDAFEGSDSLTRRRNRSSSIITNPYDDAPNEDFGYRGKPRQRSGRFAKYSPTASMKRGKAEKLLKEHGSPPGIRVTAGGRIVPDGLSPVASPRFDQHATYKFSNPDRVAQQLMNNMTPKDWHGVIIDHCDGRLSQFVGTRLTPLENRNGMVKLIVPAPPSQFVPGIAGMHAYGQHFAPQMYQPFQPVAQTSMLAPNMHTPPAGSTSADYNAVVTERQIRVIEQVHAKLEQELKDLDRNEVLQRGSLNAGAKAEIVRTRMELVTRIDESRRGVIEAKRLMNEKGTGQLNPNAIPQYGLGIFASGQVQFGGPPMESYYNGGAQPYPVPPFDPPAYNGQQFPLQGQDYQHPPQVFTVPPYPTVQPTFQPFQAPQSFEQSGALQERAGNAGMGAANNSGNTRASTETIKAYPSNLDGSSHQPRRSHAVAIKDPNDGSAKLAALNPTSPNFQPAQMSAPHLQEQYEDNGDVSNFVPSPSLVAQMDNLVRSPKSDNGELEHRSSHQPSSDSATTGDFFPHDTKQHSSRKYSYSAHDAQVNLPAWMPRGTLPFKSAQAHMTPGNLASKLIWNDAADDGYYGASDLTQERRSNASRQPSGSVSASISPQHQDHSCDMDFIAQSAFTHISPATKQHQSAHLRESTGTLNEGAFADSRAGSDPVSHLLQKASEQAAVLSNRSPSKSSAYWEGYKTGLELGILESDTSDDHRLGYRDGIVQSSKQISTGPQCAVFKKNSNRSSSSSLDQHEGGSTAMGMSVFGPPVVPQNSVATTPVVQRSMRERSPMVAQSLDSPQAQADFMSQPNVNVNIRITSAQRKSSAQSSALPFRSEEHTSPLASRYPSKSMGDTAAGKFFAMQNNAPVFDQQRYQKGQPSVAQTNDPAKAHFSAQVDGSEEEGKNKATVEAPTATCMTPMSPRMKRGSSPVKSAATAAVASIANLARSTSARKEQTESPKLPSPDKRAWRSKWRKNSEVRKPEGDDMDALKKQFSGL